MDALRGGRLSEKSSTIGAAFAGMVRVRPNLCSAGVRYFRQYEGIGLGQFSGRALSSGRPPISSSGEVAAHSELEDAGLGPPGRIGRQSRPRQFRASAGAVRVGVNSRRPCRPAAPRSKLPAPRSVILLLISIVPLRDSGMNPVDLVGDSVCCSRCRLQEQHLVFNSAGSPARCAVAAALYRDGSATIRSGRPCAGAPNIRTRTTRRDASVISCSPSGLCRRLRTPRPP